MSIMSRDFTVKEKVLILLLCLVLIGVAYYRFVDVPIREDLATAESEKSSLQIELNAINNKIRQLQRMKDEIEDVTGGGTVSIMESYNNSKQEISFLNDVLSAASQYTISFTNITRNGDQIRRYFTLQFTAPDYDTMLSIVSQLSNSHYRCLIGDMQCSAVTTSRYYTDYRQVSASMTATFYETMVGGIADAGLPADSSAK